MKTFFIPILLIAFIASCKKRNNTVCAENWASISGKYKITRLEQVSYNTGAAQDITSTLTNCQASGIYTLRPDSSITYLESTNCNGSGNGTWQLSPAYLNTLFRSGGGLLINAQSIVSWDCSDLVLITQFPGASYNFRITLTKF